MGNLLVIQIYIKRINMLKIWAKFNNVERFIIIAIVTVLTIIGYWQEPEITVTLCTVIIPILVISSLIEFNKKQSKNFKSNSDRNEQQPKETEIKYSLEANSPYVTSSTGDKVLLKDDYIYINKGKSSKIANCIANNTWEAIDTVDLRIPLDVITVINYKDSGMYKGYLEFIYSGFNVRPRDIIKHLQENIVTFNTKEESEIFFSFKEIVEERIKELKNQNKNKNLSIADEIKKLADLKNQGILTEEEFLQQKNKLMGL